VKQELSANTTIAHYRIVTKLGAGGMGEVYLAQDTKLERRVAIKFLNEEFSKDIDKLNRFNQEAKAASALNHPNILTVYEIGEVDGKNYIATELIDGKTLREHLSQKEPLSLNAILRISVQVAEALAAAHQAGIIHRDIKPENIMLRTDGYAKVLDFGLAKLAESRPSDPVDAEAPTRMAINTDTGVVMGTLIYMSPEQARGLPLDARTDIFSFGVVIYEMMTGRLPFDGANQNEILASILGEKEPAPLARYMREVPPELERILTKALRKERDERYQTMKDLLLDLKSLRQDLDFERKRERSGGITNERAATVTKPAAREFSPFTSRRTALLILAVLTLIAVGVAILTWRLRKMPAQPQIRSLAVLPLKSLDGGENFLGLGIADALIRRISQTGELTVRPTSAVRRYLNEETDALTAARQLNADAVLEGSVQRSDDRLRVSVNLLRVIDGASLWADSFDMQMTDIFSVQDTVAQQVASRLRLQLDPSQQAQLTRRHTSNPIAYEFYVKGVYNFDQRMSSTKQQMETSIDFFKKAVAADPNFALAHAQLAYAYASLAVFRDPTQPMWAQLAKEEITRAQTLDPQLAETHLARFQLLFSSYEGFQVEAAIREVLLAQQLNPNVGHAELAYLYTHVGLEDLATRELQRAFDIDPTSEFVKGQMLVKFQMGGEYDEWLAAHQRLFPNEPVGPWYFLGTGRLDEAQKAIEERSAQNPNDIELLPKKAMLSALKGDFQSAEAAIPSILSKHPVKDPIYHHAAYDIACIYALEGKSDEAVKWLREAVATGFLPYPMFERDAYLNRIRQAPEFLQFMVESKARWESYRREFGGDAKG